MRPAPAIAANSAALRGFRPIAEIQYLAYVLYALQILSDDLARAHRGVAVRMLRDGGMSANGAEPPELVRFRALLDELRREEHSVGLAALTVAVRELGAIAEPTERRK